MEHAATLSGTPPSMNETLPRATGCYQVVSEHTIETHRWCEKRWEAVVPVRHGRFSYLRNAAGTVIPGHPVYDAGIVVCSGAHVPALPHAPDAPRRARAGRLGVCREAGPP